jgi:Chaperone of endosialidase
MTQYLVFDNQRTGGIGTQKELVVNWNNINYIKEVSTSSFKLRLNSGAELTFSVSTGTSKAIIDSIQDVVKSQANGRILRVKPTSINAFQLSGITYAGTLLTVPTTITSFNTLIIGSSASVNDRINTGLGWGVFSGISTNAQRNVAIGNQNMQYCNGKYNVSIGHDNMQQHYNGDYNIAIGYDCMTSSGYSEGAANSSNVIIGAQAARDIDEGCSNNVGVGRSTLGNLNQNGSPGSSNTAVGNTAGNGLFSGDNNTLLGNSADPSTVNVSNEFVLGNSSVGVLRCAQGTISALSDERDKTSVEDLPYGLEFVDSLKPKRFVWNNRPETKLKINDKGEKIEVEITSANKGKKDIGFIAQELQTVDDDFLNLVYDSNPEKLEASYSKLIPVLVKAIQELKAELDKKQDK